MMDAIVILAYYLVVLAIGVIANKRTRSGAEYILGGRSFGPYITALGAGASDMGGWLLIGLPGAVFQHGLNEIWMPVGLTIGAFCNWTFVAKRLRVFSELANDALTLPQYLSSRFFDDHNQIRFLMAMVSLVFFTIYVAAGLVGFALLFDVMFGWAYKLSLIIGAFSIVAYVCIGGFTAVNWVDMFQGSLMFFALVLAPVCAFHFLHHSHAFTLRMHMLPLGFSNPFSHFTFLGMLSLFAWGLGYFGQPHILVRFMAAKNPSKMHIARNCCLVWMAVCLLGAIGVGFFGALLYLHDPLMRPESVFLMVAKNLFLPFLAAVLFAAVLSAVMSTISAQLLVCSSAIVEDILLKLWKKRLSSGTEKWLNRLGVAIVAFIALMLTYSAGNNMLSLVEYAWAGLGAAFGPVVLLSLFMRSITRAGAVSGIFVGGVTVILWHWLGVHVGGFFHLYELLPGFLLSVITIITVSAYTKNRKEYAEILALYDQYSAKMKSLA